MVHTVSAFALYIPTRMSLKGLQKKRDLTRSVCKDFLHPFSTEIDFNKNK